MAITIPGMATVSVPVVRKTTEFLAPPPKGYIRGKEKSPADFRYAVNFHLWLFNKQSKAGFDVHAESNKKKAEEFQKQLDCCTQSLDILKNL